MGLEVVLGEHHNTADATAAPREYGPVTGAEGLSVTRGVKVPRTAQFTMPEGHPLRQVARQGTRTIVKVYDRDSAGARTLKHCGPLTSYRRAPTGDGVAITIGSTDAAWYLDHRCCRVNSRATAGPKRGLIMKWMIMDMNGDPPFSNPPDPEYSIHVITTDYGAGSGGCGIKQRSIADTPMIDLDAPQYEKVSALFARLTAGLDGPDWAIYPAEPFVDMDTIAGGVGAHVRFGYLDVAPVIGTMKPDVVFEYGMGRRNVTAFEEIIDPNTQANLIIAETPTGSQLKWNSDAVIAAGMVISDVLVTSVPSLPDATFITQLIDDHLLVREYPRQIITFTVVADVAPDDVVLENRDIPRPGIDYDFGDIVTFKATERVPVFADDGTLTGYGEELTVDGLFRIYSLTESDDNNGARTTQLTVVAS